MANKTHLLRPGSKPYPLIGRAVCGYEANNTYAGLFTSYVHYTTCKHCLRMSERTE